MSLFAIAGHQSDTEQFFDAFSGDDFDCCTCEARAIAVNEPGRKFVCPRCRKEWKRVADEDGCTGWEEVI